MKSKSDIPVNVHMLSYEQFWMRDGTFSKIVRDFVNERIQELNSEIFLPRHKFSLPTITCIEPKVTSEKIEPTSILVDSSEWDLFSAGT